MASLYFTIHRSHDNIYFSMDVDPPPPPPPPHHDDTVMTDASSQSAYLMCPMTCDAAISRLWHCVDCIAQETVSLRNDLENEKIESVRLIRNLLYSSKTRRKCQRRPLVVDFSRRHHKPYTRRKYRHPSLLRCDPSRGWPRF